MSTSTERGYHHRDLRRALVHAALALLAEGGVDALSLRAVARRAGVSAMAPYRHYPDKEALVAAVAIHGFDGLREVLSRADETAAPGQALVAQAVAYVRYASEHPALFRLMFGRKRASVHSELIAAGEAAYAVLATRVAGEMPAGADGGSLVLGCWSLVHGLAMLFLDGLVQQDASGPPDDLTHAVAQAMLGMFGRAGR